MNKENNKVTLEEEILEEEYKLGKEYYDKINNIAKNKVDEKYD